MNLKKYLTNLKYRISTLLLGYSAFLILVIIRSYINNTSLNKNLILPAIFYNTITYGILFGILISPFIHRKFKNKFNNQNKG